MMIHLLSAAPDIEVGITDAIEAMQDIPPETLLTRAKMTLIEFLPRLAGAIILLIIAKFVIKGLLSLMKRLLKMSGIDATLHSFMLGMFKYAAWIIAIVASLLILNVPASPLVAILGSIGLALSLALKDSLSNLAGGISIIFNRPYLKGDLVGIKDVVGKVLSIELCYTKIEADDGAVVCLPNGDAAKSVVTNYSVEPLKRMDIPFRLPEEVCFEQAKEMICAVVAQNPYPLKELEPVVLAGKNEDGRVITLKVWVKADRCGEALAELEADIRQKLVGRTTGNK